MSLTISNVSQIKSSLTGSRNIIFSEIEFGALSSSRDSTTIYTRNLSLLLLTSLITLFTLERRPLFNANLRCICVYTVFSCQNWTKLKCEMVPYGKHRLSNKIRIINFPMQLRAVSLQASH